MYPCRAPTSGNSPERVRAEPLGPAERPPLRDEAGRRADEMPRRAFRGRHGALSPANVPQSTALGADRPAAIPSRFCAVRRRNDPAQSIRNPAAPDRLPHRRDVRRIRAGGFPGTGPALRPHLHGVVPRPQRPRPRVRF